MAVLLSAFATSLTVQKSQANRNMLRKLLA